MVYMDRHTATAVTATAPATNTAGCSFTPSKKARIRPPERMAPLRRRVSRSRRSEPIRGKLPQRNSSSWPSFHSVSGSCRCRFWCRSSRRRCHRRRRGWPIWVDTHVCTSRSNQSGCSLQNQTQSFRFCFHRCQMLRRSSESGRLFSNSCFI